jgi:hypothetical protein
MGVKDITHNYNKVKWDGNSLLICRETGSDIDIYDIIGFTKSRGMFYLYIPTDFYMHFKIEFSDGGFKKNKLYDLEDLLS